MRTLLDLANAPMGANRQTMLASLGQRYRDMPAASFDERFGPYNVGPITDPELLRRLFMEEQMRQIPGLIRPGTPSWPAGFIQI